MSKFTRREITSLDDVGDRYILTMTEVARLLDVHPSTASDWCARGIIRGAFQAGRFWRIEAGQLKKHIESHRLPHNEQIASIRDTARSRRRAS